MSTCHCTDCQEWSGSSNGLHFEPLVGDVSFEGSIKEYVYQTDLGHINKRFFCGECGSLFAQYCDKWRGEIDIHAGNFQECRSMPITKEIYVRSKFTALRDVPGATQFLTDSSGAPMTPHSASFVATTEYIGTLPSSADRITGHCLCGQTRTSLPGAALRSFLIACHCGDCQHFTGSSNSILISLLRSVVTFEGPLREAKGSTHNGGQAYFTFCDNCGSSIYISKCSSADTRSESKVEVFCGSFPALRGCPLDIESHVHTKFASLP